MGVEKDTYYGPFLVFRPIRQFKESYVRGCEVCKTSNNTDRFCPKCGKPLSEYTQHSPREFDIITISDAELYSPDGIRDGDFRVAIPNQFNDEIETAGGLELISRHGGSTIKMWANPEDAENKFRQLFASHISWLEQNGGLPEVKFGVFEYYY